jgi:threonine/homoserine/homoserine lactone efflux protein
MPDISSLTIFFIAGMVLLVTPGPAVLYIVAQSIDQGKSAGIISTLGIAVGTLFHVTAAAFGISAILMSSALAFSIVKYAGAAYLVYLGIKTILSDEEIKLTQHVERKKLSRIFYQGVIVNLLNPKTALFFFAFLPQFISRSNGSVTEQILFLGIIFILMGIVSDGMYSLLAGSLGEWLRNNTRFVNNRKYFTGSIYLLLGVAAALVGTKNK